MPSEKWTTKDELSQQYSAWILVQSAAEALEKNGNKGYVAEAIVERSLEMRSLLLTVLGDEDFRATKQHLTDAIRKAPRPTMGAMGPVE